MEKGGYVHIKLLIFMLVSILLGSPYILAEEGCPFPKKYIEIDRAYHQCANGLVRKGASCELFIDSIPALLGKYDCKRSFDTQPVPALWLFDAAAEDYIQLIYQMASKSNPVFNEQWFMRESVDAEKIFLSPEFKLVLDGHMAEEYYPLIEYVRNTQ